MVLHLGCGLDSRVTRIGGVRAEWYDVDHPEAIELRRLFYEETASRRMIGASVTDPHWMDMVPGGRPAMIVAARTPPAGCAATLRSGRRTR